jgi:hypothetical protein
MKKTTEKKERQLKVNREIKRSGSLYKSKDGKVPSLKLSGEWFREAGFEIGQNVRIQIKKGKLIIQALE